MAMMAVTMMTVMESVVPVAMTVTGPMGNMVVAVTMTIAVAVTVGSGFSLGGGEGQANDGDSGQQKTLHGVSPRFSFFWVGGPA
jgi:hypothetical protein